MSIAALAWSIVTLLVCLSAAGSAVVNATLFHTLGNQLTRDERWRLVGVFVAISLLPGTAAFMGAVGKSRAQRLGTLGRGIGEAAQVLALIAFLVLGVAMVATLAIVTSDS